MGCRGHEHWPVRRRATDRQADSGGGLIFDRVLDGRVAERWEQWDQPAMLRQLGLA